jgi:D-3-phosphoglycerate dehydrogenase
MNLQSPVKILHLDSNNPTLWAQLEEAGFINEANYTATKQEVETKLQEYNGIVIRSRFKIDRQFIDAATSLKFIARVGAGLESIDTAYAESKGITLIAAPEGNRNAVGEQALGMLLSLFNNLNRADRQVRNGEWVREGNRGHELEGKTVGLIGYGNMGKSFAKKLRGFDVEVLCYDIKPLVGDANAKQVTLEELQAKADVLSLHTPSTPETDMMVNADFINAFAKPFWLVNTARGKAVVTNALAAALQSGKVLGAALDVLEYEQLSFEHLFTDDNLPPAFEYLLGADNVLLSPHIAGWTFESHVRLAQVIADKIKALYFGTNQEPAKDVRVTGIGGLFFKAANPAALRDWYKDHLGFDTNDYGCSFAWTDHNGNEATTQWSPFKEDTPYFAPSQKEFMQNFRVHDMDGLLIKLKAEGVAFAGEPESHDYGKFAWVLDPEGNKIELWEPNDNAL